MADGFPDGFLRTLGDLELVSLQHRLRAFPEDKVHLDQVLEELRFRETPKTRRVKKT